MRYFLNIPASAFLVVFLLYLVLPTPPFPEPLPNSPQSTERGDSTDLVHKRAYFTDFKRDEVLAYYQNELSRISFLGFGIPVPTYRLNYPPEEGKQIIHGQIRTSYLEEIVHPFRESFYVNGFIPPTEKDTIIIDGRQFYEKVNVRYVNSYLFVRVGLAITSFILLMLLLRNFWQLFKK